MGLGQARGGAATHPARNLARGHGLEGPTGTWAYGTVCFTSLRPQVWKVTKKMFGPANWWSINSQTITSHTAPVALFAASRSGPNNGRGIIVNQATPPDPCTVGQLRRGAVLRRGSSLISCPTALCPIRLRDNTPRRPRAGAEGGHPLRLTTQLAQPGSRG